jgi:hypothetical protein
MWSFTVMDHVPPQPAPVEPVEPAMPCCCARCGAAFDARTQQQIRMLQRFADLGMALAEAVAHFPIRTKHLEANDTYHFEILSRGVRRSLALECKLTEDARRRHAREVHGAPPPRERTPEPDRDPEPDPESEPESGPEPEDDEPATKPLPPVTAEDVEPVTGAEQAERERPEDTLADTREALVDRFVDDHTPAVVASSICRDLDIEEDVSVFLEPVPTRDDPWVRAEAEAAAAAAGDVGEVPEAGASRSDVPRPEAKVRDPP